MLRCADVLRLSALALLGIGVLAVHSAGMNLYAEPGDASGAARWLGMFASKHTALAVLAAVTMLLASQFDAAFWLSRRNGANPLLYALPVAVALCAVVLVPGVGVEVNGAKRWLAIPGTGLSFQPSEVMKWSLLAALAAWCGKRSERMGSFFQGLLPAGLLIALGCGLILTEDLGTAVLLGGVSLIVVVAGGAKLLHLAPSSWADWRRRRRGS